MNCIYKYKGKDYTKEEFYSLVRDTMVQPRTVQKYEKVLFPSGNTASKIEGHTTLEEFKKQKEDRIKELEKPIETVSEIYNKLGNKTKEGNVLIQSVYQTAGVQYAKSIGGIFSLRVNGTNNQFGNPFSNIESEIQKGLIRTKSTKESVEKYIEWVLSPTTTIKPEQHKFIRDWLQSGKLKEKPIVYYKELGEPSHATALDYLINKYDWNKNEIEITQLKQELERIETEGVTLTPEMNQAIQLAKFTSEIKPGVEELFESNPELANIGSQQLYSQYLDTIFPDSQVKDIVYHGSPNYFEQFDKNKLGNYTGAASAKEGIFFGSSIDVSKNYLDKRGQTLKVNDFIKHNPEIIQPTVIGIYKEKINEDGFSEESYTVFKNGKVRVYTGGMTSYITDLDKVIHKFEEPLTKEEHLKWYIDNVKLFERIVKEQPHRQKELINSKDLLDKAYNYEPSVPINELSKLVNTNDKIENNKVDFLEKYIKREHELKSTYDENYGGYIDKNRDITDSPFENLFIRPFILSISNPLITSDEGKTYREETYFERIIKAKEENKDGVIIKDTYDSKFQTKSEIVYVVFEPEQIHILGSKQDIERFKDWAANNQSNVQYQLPQNIQGEYNDVVSPFEKMTRDEQVAFEKTIRDLSARIADRVGIPYKIENRKDLKYKGKIENGVAYINLAYATLDTPIHEILGHPIIREILKNNKTLYQNLLKELETGRGKEVFEQVKRDYKYKESLKQITLEDDVFGIQEYVYKIDGKTFNDEQKAKKYQKENPNKTEYTLEEQQEEAIVQIIGLYSARKLDKLKDKTLIQLIKELLKEMSDFVKLIFKKEINITKDLDNISELTDTELNKLLKNGEITKKC